MARKKKEHENDAQKMASTISKIRQEDEEAQTHKFKQKILEHQKWRETWDAEQQVLKLKMNVEQGLNPVKQTQFLCPIKLPETKMPQSRSSSVTTRRQKSSGKNLFITSELPEEIYSTKGKEKEKEEKNNGGYPWEKRERSREQYREITKKSS